MQTLIRSTNAYKLLKAEKNTAAYIMRTLFYTTTREISVPI